MEHGILRRRFRVRAARLQPDQQAGQDKEGEMFANQDGTSFLLSPTALKR
jgi:hypothetical protein